jgi:chromosome partitioning protein
LGIFSRLFRRTPPPGALPPLNAPWSPPPLDAAPLPLPSLREPQTHSPASNTTTSQSAFPETVQNYFAFEDPTPSSGPEPIDETPAWMKYPVTPTKGHIIVFANEKGGVGKSTSAFHTCIALCNAGERVAALDVDLRQLTLQRALWARIESSKEYGVNLPGPEQIMLAQQNENELEEKLRHARIHNSFIVIDVGGHDSPIARKAIFMADTIVTPVNDSFIDLDMLGRIDPRNGELKTLGNFARLVEHLKEPGLSLRSKPLEWVVMQNHLRNFATKNERKVRDALEKIAPVAGFRLTPGLRERVTYRELFPLGLTLFDLDTLPDLGKPQPNAREEIWAMLRALNLPSAALNRAIGPQDEDEKQAL